MHAFEQLFGVAPDGGTGLTELLILAALAFICLAARRLRGNRTPIE